MYKSGIRNIHDVRRRKEHCQALDICEETNVELQDKLDGFRANFEADINRKTVLDNEAIRVKNGGAEERALKAGQWAPDFELPDFAGNRVALAQLRANGPLALIFYRGLW